MRSTQGTSTAVNPPMSYYADGNPTARESFRPSRTHMGRETTPFGTNPFEARSSNEANRRVRPSHFQKGVKSYDGSGDPHNHLARVKQFARAEQV